MFKFVEFKEITTSHPSIMRYSRTLVRLSKGNGSASEKPNKKLHQINIKSRDQSRNSFKIIASLNTDAVYSVVRTKFFLNGL